LKRGAVTPAKLSRGSKASLVGRAGPQGSPGPKGDTGARGLTGPQGPGAISFDRVVPEASTFFKSFQGIEIGTTCKPNQIRIELRTVGETQTLKVGGTYTVWAEPTPVTAPADGLNNGLAVYAVATEEEVVLNVIARNTAVGDAWGGFNLTLDEECNFRGMYTPSSAG
jgi:hypothetical protein